MGLQLRAKGVPQAAILRSEITTMTANSSLPVVVVLRDGQYALVVHSQKNSVL